MRQHREFQADKVPLPRSINKLPSSFPRQNLAVEIGSGAGLHALTQAKALMKEPAALPWQAIIAIEHGKERFAKLQRRYENHGSPEVLLPLPEDAEAVFCHLLPPSSVAVIWLLFPNPYPKAAQANKRWHNMPFAQRMIQCLQPGGQLHLATNESFYAAEARAGWAHQGLLLAAESTIDHPSEPAPRTHFERKYRQRGQTIHNQIWQKP